MAEKIINEHYSDFVGSGMRADFIKEKIDLTHVRGYAVLVVRVTSPDVPDDKATYNMYQVDAGIARASGSLFESLKWAVSVIDPIKEQWTEEMDEGGITAQAENFMHSLEQAKQALAEANK